MIKVRPKCPVCGTRLNEGAIQRDVELGNGDDVIEQDIGGRGMVATVDSYDYDSEQAMRSCGLKSLTMPQNTSKMFLV